MPALRKTIVLFCTFLCILSSPPAYPVQPGYTQTTQRPVQWATPINAQFNLFQIDTDLYRSQQPQPQNLDQIKALGIRTVISFRAFHSDDLVIQAPEIMLIRIPINTWHIKDRHIIAALDAIQQARQNGPVLIHCQHGADRTGLVSAMYRVIYQGWQKEDALKEMTEGGYGYHSIWTNIPRYLEQANIQELQQQLRYPPERN